MIGFLLTFVAASVLVLMLVWILKGLGKDDKEILAAEFAITETDYILCNQWPWFYAVTKSGCTNTNIHAEIMKIFCLCGNYGAMLIFVICLGIIWRAINLLRLFVIV